MISDAVLGAFKDVLQRGANEIGVPLTDSQLEACSVYAASLLAYNEHTNLTRIVDPEEIAIKHFVDSLTVLAACPSLAEGLAIADVGTGAGFPGLVLKIARPDLRMVLIDSLGKRLAFLATVIQALELKDVTLFHQRAEDAGRRSEHRDVYDVVTARAVAALPTLIEWCGPLLRPGGRFVAMKSNGVDLELAGAARASDALRLKLDSDVQIELPASSDAIDTAPVMRRLLVYRKLQPTPKLFPRSPAQIKVHPLA